MALIKCPECGKEMSDQATSCPNCGCPIEIVKKELESKRIKDEELQKTEAAKNEVEAKAAKTAKKDLFTFAVVIVLIICVIVGYVIYKQSNRPLTQEEIATASQEYAAKEAEENRQKREHDKSDAYYTSQVFVKRNLKAPSTAEFPSQSESTITMSEDGSTYKIYSFVDSQNGFGAMIRTKYYVKMIKDGSDWKLLDIKFGN